MKAPRTALLTAVVAIFALPAPALAEYLVPPGNSAVNQYTESVPTAGGHRGVREDGNGRTPDKVLGRGNTERLEAHGEEGREAAEVAAETAPVTTDATPEPEPTDEGNGTAAGGAGGSGNGGGQGGGNRLDQPATGGPTQISSDAGNSVVEVEGSSGFGEVLAQATGSSSSGQLGLLLPLIILGVAAWAIAFLLRQRKQPTS